jgi:ankyrin repeat protein
VLHVATQFGRLKIVQELMKDLDIKNPVAKGFHNLTPLHQAAIHGYI